MAKAPHFKTLKVHKSHGGGGEAQHRTDELGPKFADLLKHKSNMPAAKPLSPLQGKGDKKQDDESVELTEGIEPVTGLKEEEEEEKQATWKSEEPRAELPLEPEEPEKEPELEREKELEREREPEKEKLRKLHDPEPVMAQALTPAPTPLGGSTEVNAAQSVQNNTFGHRVAAYIADTVARFCNNKGISQGGDGWEVKMELRPDVLPATTLHLGLSPHWLLLRFEIRDNTSLSLVSDHHNTLVQKLEESLDQRREISISYI